MSSANDLLREYLNSDLCDENTIRTFAGYALNWIHYCSKRRVNVPFVDFLRIINDLPTKEIKNFVDVVILEEERLEFYAYALRSMSIPINLN